MKLMLCWERREENASVWREGNSAVAACPPTKPDDPRRRGAPLGGPRISLDGGDRWRGGYARAPLDLRRRDYERVSQRERSRRCPARAATATPRAGAGSFPSEAGRKGPPNAAKTRPTEEEER